MPYRGERNLKHRFSKGRPVWNKGQKFPKSHVSEGDEVKTVRLTTDMHEQVINTSCIGVEPVIQGPSTQIRLLRPKPGSTDTVDDFCVQAERSR